MNIKELKLIASILLEMGYAIEIHKWTNNELRCRTPEKIGHNHEWAINIDPFIDDLEARKQLDILEDWFEDSVSKADEYSKTAYIIWIESEDEISRESSNHQYRADRLIWCIQQLATK